VCVRITFYILFLILNNSQYAYKLNNLNLFKKKNKVKLILIINFL